MGAWAILAFCIVAEVSATSLLTRSEGFARPVYGLLTLVILGGCFWALSHARETRARIRAWTCTKFFFRRAAPDFPSCLKSQFLCLF